MVPSIPIEALAGHADFRHLRSLPAAIDVDLRYASANNFAGRVLYAGIDCAWLRREAAAGLEAAAGRLAIDSPGWRLRVLDALRPHRVQQALWAQVQGTPAQAYFADPARGSIHSWGMAVDATLLQPDGQEVDMGSGFDEMSPRSHPELHARLLRQGVLNPTQVAARECLAQALAHGGFRGIGTEWWHFELGERNALRRHWPRVD